MPNRAAVIRHILHPENSTLRWNMVSAPLEYPLSQSICTDLHEWHPVENINVCRHEFWLVLDLDQDKWKIYDKFTLRLSWLAYVRRWLSRAIIQFLDSLTIAPHRHKYESVRPIISNDVS
jgi:hypothetical protein